MSRCASAERVHEVVPTYAVSAQCGGAALPFLLCGDANFFAVIAGAATNVNR